MLSEHMKETADRMGGYLTGTLVIENGLVSMQAANGGMIALDGFSIIEVRNGDVYESITVNQALVLSDLVAGLYVRCKR